MPQFTDLDLIRRHSVHLRSPPHGSLADDILKSSNIRLQRVQAMMSDVEENLSDFGSCLSSNSSDSENENSDNFKIVERKKSGTKRKKSLKPPKTDYFLKKPNRSVSPQ